VTRNGRTHLAAVRLNPQPIGRSHGHTKEDSSQTAGDRENRHQTPRQERARREAAGRSGTQPHAAIACRRSDPPRSQVPQRDEPESDRAAVQSRREHVDQREEARRPEAQLLAHLGTAPAGSRRANSKRTRSRHVDALENAIRGDRATLTLATLRFLSHPSLPAVFPDYLISLYHSMRTAGALMEEARARSAALAQACPVAARLVPYWTRHIREEAGHDEWVIGDLARLGVDIGRARLSLPTPEVAELMGTLHFWIRHTHPVAVLSYFYVVERNPPTVELLDWMVERGIPRDALQTFYRHARIDVEHGRELGELIDSLPLEPSHVGLLALSATTVLRQLARIYEAVLATPRRRSPTSPTGHRRGN